MNILYGTDIQSTGGLYEDHQRGILLYFSGDNSFLLITAAHGAYHRLATLSASDIVFFYQFFTVVFKNLLVQHSLMAERLFVVVTQCQILRKREIHDQSIILSVLGNIGNSFCGTFPDGQIRNISAI